uniref:Uncharacterized protein n=1 Tax=viral metagenome TaxID=1070528 RepID=A0A6H1ZWS8_9ZZZZ
MAAIKPLEQSSDKWVRRASVAGPDYQAGVQNPRKAWASAALEGEGNYKAGVTAAAARGAFGAGVRAAGDAKWQKGALQKGPGRFAEGVAIGKDEWNKGFAPYQSAIAAITLPPRGAKGSPQNIQRVAAIAMALRTLREKGGK